MQLGDGPTERGDTPRIAQPHGCCKSCQLDDNQSLSLAVIPPELGSLTMLQELDLSDNHLSGVIPPKLGSLANLQRLSLDNNQLSGVIPPELG